jgi:hypothetical protein
MSEQLSVIRIRFVGAGLAPPDDGHNEQRPYDIKNCWVLKYVGWVIKE